MQAITFPDLSPEAQTASQALHDLISQRIAEQNGWISFAEFMQLALYAPQWGYYTGGATKIGQAGDFITAPTLSPLFGASLAIQIIDLLEETDGNIYEFGAGTGALAATLLQNIPENLLKNYYIIELSSDLAQRQQDYLRQHVPQHVHKVHYLTELPEFFDGIILGNEVLDAMPVERVMRDEHGDFFQVGVSVENQIFYLKNKPLYNPNIAEMAQMYFPHVPYPYTSEVHLAQNAFVRTLAEKLQRGAMIWIDYGFDSKQYYHEQRDDGTLIGHNAHHSIHDPFFRLGLTDLTAHINFTDIAEVAMQTDLDLIGYTSQAMFLFNLGILDLLNQSYPDKTTREYVEAAHAVQVLTGQHEMGELFKIMALGKNISVDWRGFAFGDMCHKL